MLQQQRIQLESNNISLNGSNSEIHFGVGEPSELVLEEYVELRNGRFDFESVGAFTYIGGGQSVVRNVGKIGRFCSIAPSIFTGPVEHPTNTISPHPLFQGGWSNKWSILEKFYNDNSSEIKASKDKFYRETMQKITIGNNVWIGEGVFIRQGVQIGDGAVIASRSVVTKNVSPFSIVGGTPAKLIKMKHTDVQIEKFLNIKWWNYELSVLNNVKYDKIDEAIKQIEENISKGAKIYNPKKMKIKKDGVVELI